ncbi:GNAT family N-acetyltransferase [Paenibacillus ferrarius]|uniref:GNAT family N-acetyltransferase n=1 Tax=Paenibacillus ferrarius TaxID=1469647 RepID=A0A1V4HT03_9BACL|nr:GNAT family N-acetyltransferase [Paenibacillus ferrarius]OPH61387.1 GNAT family N-acetyltransferase [Paenibacillus ferrarius]
MTIFLNNDICLRRLELKDSNLLVNWLSNPEVLAYYEGRDRPHNLELVRKHFFEDRDEITQCIIQYKNTDIGFIQFYLIGDEEIAQYGYQDDLGIIYGMDQFIGETEFWNQGIGYQLIKETVRYLIENRSANKIVLDPQAWNTRAIRVYEKSGFIKKIYLEEHEMHEGELRDCWLMEYDSNRNL